MKFKNLASLKIDRKNKQEIRNIIVIIFITLFPYFKMIF